MGERYLIDSNAIIDYLGGKLPINGLDFMDKVIDEVPVISVINQIELLGQNRSEITQYKLFVDNCVIYDLTKEVIQRTIALRKSRSIKIPDAIIAATALVYDLTIITHNLSDFQGIANLKILDLYLL